MFQLRSATLWLLFFLYSAGISAFVQLIVLPYILPQFHYGHGLMVSSCDSVYFDKLAVEYANKIWLHGWPAWELRPAGQGPAGIASIFYLIWPDHRVLIPWNAALQASAALVLFKLVKVFLKDRAGAVLCVLPFLLFPSNLTWMAQIHKDSYSILGVLLILLAMVSSWRAICVKKEDWQVKTFGSFLAFVGGMGLIWIVRPYVLIFLQPVVFLFFLLLTVYFLFRTGKGEISWQKSGVFLLVGIIAFLGMGVLKNEVRFNELGDNSKVLLSNKDLKNYEIEQVTEAELVRQVMMKEAAVQNAGTAQIEKSKIPDLEVDEPSVTEVVKESGPLTQNDVVALDEVQAPLVVESAPVDVQPAGAVQVVAVQEAVLKKQFITNDDIELYWARTSWLPSFLDNKFYSMAMARRGARLGYIAAKSNIDINVGFNSIKSVFLYLPRAAQIALLAPFPNQWLGEASCAANGVMRKISAIEMTIIYVALVFLFYAIWYWRKRAELWIIILFCVYMLLVYGLAICNIGTLYRMRYPYIMTLVALGISGFIVFLKRSKTEKGGE